MAEPLKTPTIEDLTEIVRTHHDTLLSIEPMFYALLRVLRVDIPTLYEEVERFIVHAQDGKPIADYLENGGADERSPEEPVVPAEEPPAQLDLQFPRNTDAA